MRHFRMWLLVIGLVSLVAEAAAAARAVFDAADAALGLPLSRLCFEGPEEELRRTEIQQPAILTTSIALLRALEERGLHGEIHDVGDP